MSYTIEISPTVVRYWIRRKLIKLRSDNTRIWISKTNKTDLILNCVIDNFGRYFVTFESEAHYTWFLLQQ